MDNLHKDESEPSGKTILDSDSKLDQLLDTGFARLVSILVAIRESERHASQDDGIQFVVTRVHKYAIDIRPKENGHNHPHFHVTCPDYQGSYRIDNQQCLAGKIPRKHEKKIQEWAVQNKHLLEKAWKRAHPTSFEQSRNVIE